MGRPHPMELRERVAAFVDEGNSHRAAARHFRVSPRFVNELERVDFYLIHKSPANDLNTGSLLAPIKVDAL